MTNYPPDGIWVLCTFEGGMPFVAKWQNERHEWVPNPNHASYLGCLVDEWRYIK